MNFRFLLSIFIGIAVFTSIAIVNPLKALAKESRECAKIIFDEDRELKDDWVDKLIESKVDINCKIYAKVEIEYYQYDLERTYHSSAFPQETKQMKVLVTPLYFALYNPDDMKKLIKAGADINKLIWTAEMTEMMAETTLFNIYDLKEKYKININVNNIKSVDGKSMMRMHIVNLLKNSYSDFEDGKITSEDTDGKGINYSTSFDGYHDTLNKLLMLGAHVKAGNEKRNELLKMSPDKFANEIVKYGFNINEKDNRGVTPLMEMIYYRSMDNMVPSPRMLEDSQKQNKNLTSRHFEHYDPIQVLIDAGADVNLADNEGHTPLHIAMHPKVIRALLNKGAKVNAKDRNGQTPLHAAVFKNISALQTILESCPNSNIKDRKGKTALDLAIANGFEEQIALLKSYSPANCSNKVPMKQASKKTPNKK